jgi:hypothetical protein
MPEELKNNISKIADVLTQFKIINCSTVSLKNGSKVHVDIKLKRIFQYHLTNTYMPTITLLIIAEITLHFDETKTELAIGLSLTILLVMYTMYQSISGSLIKTAYLKMIDYWLLFCLLMPFVIFMIEIYWLLKKTQHKNLNPKGWVDNGKEVSIHRKLILCLVHGITFLFVFAYIILSFLMFIDYF